MTPDDDFDLDELAQALDRVAPRPDPARRAADLRLAQEVFDRMHGTAHAVAPRPAPQPRPAPRRGWAALLSGWGAGGALTATTAVVAGAVLVTTPLGRDLLRDPLARSDLQGAAPEAETAVAAAPDAAPTAPAEVADAAPQAATPEPETEPAGEAPAAPSPLDMAEAPAEAAAPVVAESAPEAEAPSDAETAGEAAPEIVADASPAGEAAMAAPTPPPVGAGPDEAAAGSRIADAAPSVAAPEASPPSPVAAAAVALAPSGAGAAAGPAADDAARSLDDLASGLVAAAPETASEDAPDATGIAAAALAAERAGLRSVAEAPVAELELGPSTGFWDDLAADLRAGTPPRAMVRVGEILAAVPPGRAGAAEGPLGVTVLPAPWDPLRRIVLVSLPEGRPSGSQDLRLRAEWDGVASWRLLGAGTPGGTGEPEFLAAFEVTPLSPFGEGGLGALRLGWKGAGAEARGDVALPIPGDTPIAPEARFAAALAGWGLLLRGEDLGAWGPPEALALARANRGKEDAPARDEALEFLAVWEGLDR